MRFGFNNYYSCSCGLGVVTDCVEIIWGVHHVCHVFGKLLMSVMKLVVQIVIKVLH